MSTKKPIKKQKFATRYRGTDGVWRDIDESLPIPPHPMCRCTLRPSTYWRVAIVEKDGIRISTFIMN